MLWNIEEKPCKHCSDCWSLQKKKKQPKMTFHVRQHSSCCFGDQSCRLRMELIVEYQQRKKNCTHKCYMKMNMWRWRREQKINNVCKQCTLSINGYIIKQRPNVVLKSNLTSSSWSNWLCPTSKMDKLQAKCSKVPSKRSGPRLDCGSWGYWISYGRTCPTVPWNTPVIPQLQLF